MRLLTLIIVMALLLTGCASTGGKDDASRPDAGKPDAVKPAKRSGAGVPDTSVPEVEEIKKPQADDQESEAANPWLPITMVPANYPQKALDRGIEGYVVLEFTVTKTGSLKDIVVIDSSPHGYFEQAAINAASKFRYKPKIVNGEPIDVPRAQYKMIFKLEFLLSK